MDEYILIQDCKRNNAAAQKIFFEQYAPIMMTICIRYVKNVHDAEELMLNGFLNFFTQVNKFEYRGEGSTSAWLRRIMINECLMYLRRKNNFAIVALEENDQTETPAALDKLSADDILNLIIRLPTGYRTVFNLYVMDGRTHKEISQILHIKEGTSKSQLKKARGMLQQMITKMENYGNERNR